MNKVVGLKGQKVIDLRIPNEHAIKNAEWLLEACKSGEVQGFAVAIEHCDDTSSYILTGIKTYRTLGNLHAAAHQLAVDLNDT